MYGLPEPVQEHLPSKTFLFQPVESLFKKDY